MKSNPPHEDPVAHSGHASSVSHLRGLLEVTRLLRADEDLESLLNACARTVSESLGFATVVITLYRTAWNDFEVVSVHGSDAAREVLMGAVREWADWEPLLDERFHRCGAYFIEHDSFDWESVEQTSFIPEIEPSDDPDAWHPEDALIVPLHGSSPHPLGFVSVDEPASGKKPTDSELEVLVAVAAHAALAVEAAQEAVLAARHRDALDQLLRVSAQLTDSDSIESILAAVCDGIRSALGFQKVSIDLPEPDTGRLRARAAVGWDATDEVLPGAAHVREPDHHRARIDVAVRGDALPGQPRSAHAAGQPARVHVAARARDLARPALRQLVRARGVRPRRLQGGERPLRPPRR
jgi:uncharacterized protein YigA (DUF484 family)